MRLLVKTDYPHSIDIVLQGWDESLDEVCGEGQVEDLVNGPVTPIQHPIVEDQGEGVEEKLAADMPAMTTVCLAALDFP